MYHQATIATPVNLRNPATWLAAIALFLLGMLLTPTLAWAAPSPYGKTLLKTLDLPPEALAKFALFQQKNTAPPGGAVAALLADTEDWRAPEQAFTAAESPYTLLVKVQGTAIADGDVSTAWKTGWMQDGATRSTLGPVVMGSGMTAGQSFSGEAASQPTTFKTEGNYVPVLSLVRANNLKIQSVQIEIWSGTGKSGWGEKLLTWGPWLTGLVFLGLLFWWRR